MKLAGRGHAGQPPIGPDCACRCFGIATHQRWVRGFVRTVRLVSICAAIALLAEVAGTAAACAWGSTGHAVIAEIAQRRLDPLTRRRLQRLIGPDVSLASLANWADTHALLVPSTLRWHYINIPVGAERLNLERDCNVAEGGDCIVRALERQIATLSSRTAPRSRRLEALKFVVHLVGDIHQPLHCAERDSDAGGNTLMVQFFGTSMSLHRVWDLGILDRVSYDWGLHVDQVSGWLTKSDTARLCHGTPADWAWEAHQLAISTAYDLPANLNLDDAYQAKALPVVRAQLGKAAVRLAEVLKRALHAASRPSAAP
jgi:nuclease S1